MDLSIKISNQDNGVVSVAPVGVINNETVGVFDSKMQGVLAGNPLTVVVDMKDISFLSSEGVGAIIKYKQLVESESKSYILVNLQPQIKKVFEIMKLLVTLHVFESVAELDEYLLRIQKQIIDG